MRIGIAGHSHVDCMREANRRNPRAFSARFAFLDLADPALLRAARTDRRQASTPADCDEARLAQAVAALGSLDLVLALPRGNEHNNAAIADLGLGAAQIEQRIVARMRVQYARWLALLRRTVAIPLAVIPPPPPVRSAAHILRHPGGLARRLQDHAVSPPAVRMQAWRVQMRVIRRLCAAERLPLIDLPEAVFAPGGFLAPRLCARDPAHGNAAYGALLLQHIASNGTAIRTQAQALCSAVDPSREPTD